MPDKGAVVVRWALSMLTSDNAEWPCVGEPPLSIASAFMSTISE